jgi:hypothetical protein
MQIDIDKLDETQVRALNRRIVERLRFLQQMRAHAAMLSIGERVTFIEHGGEEVRGRVVRYNRKMVTVLCDDSMQWRVSPSLLCRMGPEKGFQAGTAGIFESFLIQPVSGYFRSFSKSGSAGPHVSTRCG